MNSLTAAINTKLSGDSTLTALLGTYRSSPAIFTGDLAPEDIDLTAAYIVIKPPFSDEPILDTKNSTGRRLIRDIVCWAPHKDNYSIKDLETIGERVRTLLHRVVLTVSGYTNIISLTSGPIQAPQDDHMIGLIITLATTIQ